MVWLERQSLDFYIPKYHIAIECQGGQHFKTVDFFGGKRGYSDRLKKDLSKYNKCLSNNVKLIYYVPESLVEEVINKESLLVKIKLKEIFGVIQLATIIQLKTVLPLNILLFFQSN